MRNSPLALEWATAAASVLLLAACGEAASPPAPADTPAEAAPPTRTLTPSQTDTPTLSPIPTETPTETTTFTPTIAYNMPGLYYFYKCTDFQPAGIPVAISIKFCVTSVKVNDDRTLKINVTWKLNYALPGRLTKHSDIGNNNMFLYDDLKNEYHATDWGGAAAENRVMTLSPEAGWFLFPAPKPGATVFRFYDMDNRVSIDDIVLSPDKNASPPTATPTLDPDTVYNAPGSYSIYRCVFYPPPGYVNVSTVKLCLNTVTVDENREMRFNFTWTVHFERSGNITKKSDAGNPNIFLTDNLGNEYRPTKTGGCAAQDTTLWLWGAGEDACGGWFQFPAAKPGATSFRFVYTSEEITIDGIVLAMAPEEPGAEVVPTTESMPTYDPGLTYNAPGRYYFYQCVFFPSAIYFPEAYQVKFCLDYVDVTEDREMRFFVTWTAYFDHKTAVYRPSDADNHDLYLVDNLGNKYHHIQTGGCAAEPTYFWTLGEGTDDCSGWFHFPAAKDGATAFRFVDSRNNIAIEKIVLVPKAA